MPLSLIVACAENRVIGRNGRLPFDLAEDKAWFDQKTAGHVLVMGRICFETWPKATIAGRRPIVLTRDHRLSSPLVRVAASVTEALATAQTFGGETLVCGGQRIYEETLPLADRLYLTLVHADVAGDTYFPEWREIKWRETARRESHDANYRYTFLTLDRQV